MARGVASIVNMLDARERLASRKARFTARDGHGREVAVAQESL